MLKRIVTAFLRILAGGLRGPEGLKLAGGVVSMAFAVILIAAVLQGRSIDPDTLHDMMSIINPN